MNLTTVGGLVAALVAVALPAPAAAAPSGPLVVEVVTANGSGCPNTEAAVEAAGDNQSFQVVFSGYLAWTGGPAAPTDFRENCQFSLWVHRPAGYTYAIEEASYSGFAHLDGGATGLQAAHYYFQGESSTASLRHEFAGPFSDNWRTTDTFESESLRWAPCAEERYLNVNTELRVRATPNPADTVSLMALDPVINFRLTWKPCG